MTRERLAAAADAKGNIYAIGGRGDNRIFVPPLNTVERYSLPVTIYTFIKN